MIRRNIIQLLQCIVRKVSLLGEVREELPTQFLLRQECSCTSAKERNETIFLKKIKKRIKEEGKSNKVVLQLPVSIVEPNVSDCFFSYLLLFCFLQEFSSFSSISTVFQVACNLFSTLLVANSFLISTTSLPTRATARAT